MTVDQLIATKKAELYSLPFYQRLLSGSITPIQYFHYLTEDGNNSSLTSKVKQLAFKGGMALNSTPEKMKVTMEDLKEKFTNFDELGGGNIIEFLHYLQACERDNKLNNILNGNS